MDDLPLLDEDGHEVNIYDEHGFCVPRLRATNPSICGALLDLEHVHEMFNGPDDPHGEVPTTPSFHVYPFAYTRHLGNIQSPSIMPSFAHKLREIELLLRPPLDDDDMFVDNDVNVPQGALVLHPSSFQAYNSLSHHVRTEPRFQYVQLGMVTSTLAGTATKGTPRERHWNRRVRLCEHALPHERFNAKVSGANQPQDMRFENTYTLDVYCLTENMRSGRCVSEYIPSVHSLS